MKRALLTLCLAILPGSALAGGSPQEIAAGQVVFGKWCAICHAAGHGYPGTSALGTLYEGSGIPAVLAERTDLAPDTVSYFVRNGTSIMPFFRKTEISHAELAALGAYLARNNPDQ